MKKYSKVLQNNKLSAATWNEKFELPDGLYSVSDIKVFFWVYHQSHATVTGNPPIRIL